MAGKKAARMGRPPAGPGGEKVSGFPARTIRLSPDRLAMLDAVAAVEKVPCSTIVDRALEGYFSELPADVARLAKQLARR